MKVEDENNVMIRVSTQLLIQSLGCAQKLEQEKLQIAEMRAKAEKVSKFFADSEARVKENGEKEATISFLHHEVQESAEHRQIICTTNDQLLAENSSLKVRLQELENDQLNNWAEEK